MSIPEDKTKEIREAGREVLKNSLSEQDEAIKSLIIIPKTVESIEEALQKQTTLQKVNENEQANHSIKITLPAHIKDLTKQRWLELLFEPC